MNACAGSKCFVPGVTPADMTAVSCNSGGSMPITSTSGFDISSTTGSADAAEIDAMITTAMKAAIEALAPLFERASGHVFRVIYGPSGGLARRLNGSEPADLIVVESKVLDELIKQGKVHYAGASNYAAYRLVESLWIADRRNLNGFVTLQAQYSLLERSVELEHVPAMRKHGLGLLPWSPLAGGFLSGKYRREGSPEGARLTVKNRLEWYDKERNWKILDAVTEVAKQLDATPSQVALAWLLRQPAVTSVIFGARSVAQLEDNLRATEVKLPDEAVARLSEVSAPELRYPYDFIKRTDGSW